MLITCDSHCVTCVGCCCDGVPRMLGMRCVAERDVGLANVAMASASRQEMFGYTVVPKATTREEKEEEDQ